MEVNPIAVILVYMDSKGDRLLYRYPYQQHQQQANATTAATAEKSTNSSYATIDGGSFMGMSGGGSSSNLIGNMHIPSNGTTETPKRKRNPYAISNPDDLLQTPPPPQVYSDGFSNFGGIAVVGSTGPGNPLAKNQQHGFADEVLSTLFAVKTELCNQKFELKVNDVRFVSHPTLIQRKEQRSTSFSNSAQQSMAASGSLASGLSNTIAPKPQPQQMLINIVFALQAQASYSIVKCYYELSKRMGLALKVEEQRIGYLTEETTQMARTHDDISSQQEPLERAFDLISERCSLAQALKSIYHDLCTTGLLNTTLNQNLTLSFCLPQKAHQLHKKGSIVDPGTIDRCLRALKPYHGMLLLVDFAELLDCVPPPGARMLLQLVEVYTPLLSLQSMASDAGFSIEHVYKLVSHLVYWAKATIIYPLCETNVYVIAPDAPLHTKSHLVEKFATRFAGMSLFEVIADFSLPTSIGHLTTPLQQPARQGILAQMVLWMLQHHLLMQLHTYVQFMPSDLDDMDCVAAERNLNSTSVFSSLMDLHDEERCGGVDSMLEQDDLMINSRSDDDLNAGSLLSMSSQPLPVPHTSRRSLTDGRYSADGSLGSDNISAQPSSRHKSNFSSSSTENCDSIASIEDEDKIKELLQVFNELDRVAIKRIPASMNVDDLSLLVKLYQAGYFKSEHHLEEIMYFENLRRSQLLQLLDKFRDVLIIYETEDPAIATMYNNNK